MPTPTLMCKLLWARSIAILEASRYFRAASTTIRASVTASAIADRTLGLLFCNSCDSTLANFTAAIRPATTANVPVGLSLPAAESGARKHSDVRYWRVSSQRWHFTVGFGSIGSIRPGTLQGRASVTRPHAAQQVCQCRYGGVLLSSSIIMPAASWRRPGAGGPGRPQCLPGKPGVPDRRGI
jgi:hypothetical protein